MTTPTIGILAGMGPRSTAPFIDLVVDECHTQYGATLDIDFPQMLILSQPTPFYLDRELDHDEMKRSILAGLQKLEAGGVSFIAMPCNTAHIYFDELRSQIRVPLLNIVEETLQRLPKVSRATLFATKPTFECGIYQAGFQRARCEFVFRDEWQRSVTSIIGKIKLAQVNEAAQEWLELTRMVKEEGVQALVSACTDLNVVARLHQIDTPLVDSGRALAEATVARYVRERGEVSGKA